MANEKNEPAESINDELNKQTGVIDWQELIKHFARGVVVVVDTNADMVSIAHSMSIDSMGEMQSWLKDGTVRRASDDDARDWNKDNPEFWCIVIAPWVLVQKKGAAKDVH